MTRMVNKWDGSSSSNDHEDDHHDCKKSSVGNASPASSHHCTAVSSLTKLLHSKVEMIQRGLHRGQRRKSHCGLPSPQPGGYSLRRHRSEEDVVHERHRVRFADSVNVVDSDGVSESVPEISYLKDLFRPQTMTNDEQVPAELTKKKEEEEVTEEEEKEEKYSFLTLVPQFRIPPADSAELQARFARQNVCLVRVEVMSDSTVVGWIRARSLDYHKAVYVRYKRRRWTQEKDVRAEYVATDENGGDRFTFNLPCSTMTEECPSTLTLAVGFHCAAGHMFWDNNDGEDYKFDCVKVASHVEGCSSRPD